MKALLISGTITVLLGFAVTRPAASKAAGLFRI
jgi:hypothetical protein